jgi:death-on-curing family protein
MRFFSLDIQNEYERWIGLIGHDPYKERSAIGIHDVIRAHFCIVDYFTGTEYGLGGIGPRDLGLLHSAIYRQFVSFGGKDKWAQPIEKCATLLYGLVKDHPFHDANKRTAFLVCLYHLETLGRTPQVEQREFEDFIVKIADDKLDQYARYKDYKKSVSDPEIHFIAHYLRRATREIDRRIPIVTFFQLNQTLKKFGFVLTNQDRSFIDLVKVEQKKSFFGTVKQVEQRLALLAFPGWKSQVGKDTMRTVLKTTRLTPENGFDSKVLFQDADPLSTLVVQYDAPLKRLANR